ncbi:DUF1501 domain-containing protein [Zavarzinella formosa]|uniref:DUF1501 domain-containing protein n=1 Tax=Zavarzinella formosa TaxID=360055 RepID=UPI0002E2FECE|nr:DUF1501 domain-containing protein [Zavarzinella formosa]
MIGSHFVPNGLPSRRDMLFRGGAGIGGLALAHLLGEGKSAIASELGRPHFAPKAKRFVHLFANGGPSQVDLFDPKPLLKKLNGKPIPRDIIPGAGDAQASRSPAFDSQWKFRKYGQSGIEMSELLPNLGSVVDDLCVVRSMHADDISHDGGIMFMNTGAVRLSRPSLGSWVTYGLGSENQNLPGFIALCPDGYPLNEAQNWQSAFLPPSYQGTFVNSKHQEVDKLVENIKNSRVSSADQRAQLDLLARLNAAHQAARPAEGRLEARIQSFEQAFRMQVEAAEAFDLTKEPQKILDMYGPGPQARQLILARRLLERGVRVVQAWYGPGFPWDHHGELDERIPKACADIDRPTAAFIKDLKQRGMLDDTLVVWGGEFGRTPTAELPHPTTRPGRDHNRHGFTIWMAGGGVKKGHVHGTTDDAGFAAMTDKVHVHDLHATILHLLGLDHEKLTYRYAGRDFRLTDVHGRVVRQILT